MSSSIKVFVYMYFAELYLPLKPFCDYSLYSVCILPQPAFYSQSVVCILPLVRSLQSAVRSLRLTLTVNKHIKMRLGHRRRSLCCLETQNAPWRHWRIPSIYSEKERFIYLWSLEFRSWLRPRAVSRLRAREDYKVATERRASLGMKCMYRTLSATWLIYHAI